MNKRELKIIYLNIAVLISFMSALAIAIIILMVGNRDMPAVEMSIIIAYITPVVSGSFTFWIYELKHLMKKGEN